MHDGLRSITFHLENCETITILRKWIGDFYLSGIDTIIERIGCNYIGKYKLAKKFAIEIFKGANKEKYAPFGIEGEETTKFKRLTTYADISQIELEFDDEEESYTYVINYQSTEEEGSGLGSENINQTSKISTLGHLYIVIEEGKTVEDIFPDAIVENKEAVEFNMEMYDIGVDNEDEHILNGDNLPKFYKYLQLSEKVKDIINYRTAIRVPDKESGWKFIYEPKHGDSLEEEKIYLNYPDSWKYYETNIAKFLKKTHIENKDGFTPEELEKKYPRID